MNKSVAGVIIAVVVAGGGYMLFKDSPKDAMEAQVGSATEGAGLMSAKELLASGKTEVCTFTNKDDQSETSGTMYISKGKMRGEFKVSAAGQQFDAYMIGDGTDAYSWSSLAATGVKISLAGSMMKSDTTEKQSFDADAKVKYECEDWKADASKFEIPTDIKFMDASAMMKTMPSMEKPAGATSGNMKESTAAQCGMCDAVSNADDKAQCKLALGCK